MKPKFFYETSGNYDRRFFRDELSREDKVARYVSLLTKFNNSIKELTTKPILLHSTLVGWWWNKSFLPWNIELNMGLTIEELTELSDKKKIGALQGSTYFEINPNFAERTTANKTPEENREPNKIDARIIDMKSGLFINITAFSAVLNNDTSVSCKSPYVFPRAILYPAVASTFLDVPVYVPKDVPTVLTLEYGPAIMTPDYFSGHTFNASTKLWEEIPNADVPT